jgi:TonB-linked SusC/RagA family outer membrane protein
MAQYKRAVLAILMVGIEMVGFAQETVITGKVTDVQDGKPIPGVSIQLLGTDRGTISDVNGVYRLVCDVANPTVVFSFVGMRTQELQLGDRSVLDVQMEPDVRQLSEIVVTGTGVPREKMKLGFAIEATSVSKLPIVPTASIDQALVGRVAGANISSIGGALGSEISIILRGINSVNRSTMPIILLDGVQLGATTLSAIDPSTIDKVEVIQGAAAATIYGAQGANGVIQLFSKKGSDSSPKIEFSLSMGENEYLNVGGLRKSQMHAFPTNEKNDVTVSTSDTTVIYQNDTTLVYNGGTLPSLLTDSLTTSKAYGNNLKYHDHLKLFFKPARTFTVRLGISGSQERVDYAVSLSKLRQESNFNNSQYYDRTNLAINVGVRLSDQVKLRSTTQLTFHDNTVNFWEKQDFGDGQGSNLYYMLNTYPFVDFSKRDNEGNYASNVGIIAGANQFNPYYEYSYASTSDRKFDLFQSLGLGYSITRHLELDAIYGVNYQSRDVRHFVANQTGNNNSEATNSWTAIYNTSERTGEIDDFQSRRVFQNLKISATLGLNFDEDLGLKIPIRSTTLAAYDYRSDEFTRKVNYSLGMPLIPPQTAALGATFGTVEDYKSQFVTFGFLLDQRFDYAELAGISFGLRNDYSSAFGKGSEPFTFPRADVYFRPSSFGWWSSTPFLSPIASWKLRAAYGEAGIQPQPFDRYVTLSSRTLGSSNPALYVGVNQANSNLNVEVSKEFEWGTDLSVDLLQGSWLKYINVSGTWWVRTTENAIFSVDAAPSTGLGRTVDNALSIRSDGWHLSLNLPIYTNQSLVWKLTTNVSKQRSYFSYVKGGELAVGDRIIKEGEGVGAFNGKLLIRSLDALDPHGVPFLDSAQRANHVVASNGWVVNRSTKQAYYSPNRYSLGDPNPDLMLSAINEITFKGFLTFSLQFDWVFGSRIYNGTKQWMYRDGIHSDYERSIDVGGEVGAWTAFYRSAYTPNADWYKNYFYEDASFGRLRNASVAIDFAKLIHLGQLKKLQLVLSGRNLLTFTSYTGMDPEINTYAADWFGGTATALDRGYDNNSIPNLRSYQVSLIAHF